MIMYAAVSVLSNRHHKNILQTLRHINGHSNIQTFKHSYISQELNGL